MKAYGEKLLERMFAAPQTTNHRLGGHVLRVVEESGGIRLAVEYHEVDKIGLRLRSLRAERAGPFVDAAFDAVRLRRQAEDLARRISYLTEQIQLVELDTQNGRAQLRSAPPRRENGRLIFYEILFEQNHHLSFHRYEHVDKARSSRRAAVAFELTHGIFRRLVDDFAAVLTIS
jgi:hypothetical protein